jgi:transposase-like protein
VKLVIRDTCLGLLEALAEFYPEAEWQRCMVPWYRNVFTATPRGNMGVAARGPEAAHGMARGG